MRLEFSAYRYNPDVDDAPYMQDYTLEAGEGCGMMLLDALMQLKEKGSSLSPHCPCREGVCDSDGLNMGGKNGLARITPISALNQSGKKIVIRLLPGLPVVHDSAVDVGQFCAQCEKVKPYLLDNGKNPSARGRLQMPEQREKFDGLYECISCVCCLTSRPSFWRNPGKFIGPAGLLVAYRFLIDSRDTETDSRLEGLNDTSSTFRCHSAMSCVSVCPEGLNSIRVIDHIKSMLFKRSTQVAVVITGRRHSVLSGLWVTCLVDLISEAPSGNLNVGNL